MDRRKFVKGSAVAATLLSAASRDESQNPLMREFYELKIYHLRMQTRDVVQEFLKNAYIPVMNRLGTRPIGVFNVMSGLPSPTIYVLTPHSSLETYIETGIKLEADTEYQRLGSSYLDRKSSDPAYIRMESSLLISFGSIPKLEVPAAAAKNEPRIFELRTYESHSEKASLKKMEMFYPKMGELEIFRRVGLTPVFFGRTLIGSRIPAFTYLLTFKDMEQKDKSWNRFRTDAAWMKLKATQGYSDQEILTNITSIMLSPAPFSQI
jgi:hypothetical protein